MALQLRRLLPHGCAQRHRAVNHALLPPPTPTMLQFGVFQRYSSATWPFSPFRPCEMCGVSFRGNSSGQLFSRNSSGVFQRPKSSSFLTTGLFGNHSSVCFRATGNGGIALKANYIGNSRPFLTACSKKLRFLIKSKSSFGNHMRREDGTAHSLFHRSEKRQSTLAACSTIADEASASTSTSSKSITDAKADTAKRKSSRGSKKEVDGDMKEKKVLKKKRMFARTRKAATKMTESICVNQEDKKADNSKSNKGADSSKEKKVKNRSKSKTKVTASTVLSEAEICMKTSNDGSPSEAKPFLPLYPPTAKSVVVVESATKAKVIQNYLGDMYEVVPSYGHVRDLAGRSKSVRPDDDFSMVWEVPAAAWTHLKRIKVALKGAENLILASDPDREGEAIAWHIKEMLEQQGALGCNVTVARVAFHEITEDAIKKALMAPRYIDMDLINSYLARRSLDYLIGFGISPLLWRKLPGCQSAGRVQSAALALVCDREAEIEQFKPQEYWTVQTDFKTQFADPSSGTFIPSRIKLLKSKKLDQLSICSQEEARAIEKKIHSSQLEVLCVKRSKIHKNPPMPYITSSLQQDAANKLHFTAGYTMKVAQKLYEGISLSSDEATGLITYMRTDGFHISDGAAEDIRSLVKERYGREYASEDIRKYLKKVKNAQEAHEAIRPTSIRRLPSSLVGILDDDSLKLYTLIWKRTMACQMEASRTDLIQVDIGTPGGDMSFHSSASRLDFKGYQAVYGDMEASASSDSSEGDAVHEANFEVLSKLKVKDLVSPVNVHLGQHFTKPPPRYSEGALIKKLEELGIGRPSTYASIMKVLQDRKYVTIKSRVLHPEFRGRMVSAFLLHHFSEVADYSFTANMETELDNVSAGSTEWKGLLKDYWERFSKYCVDASKLDGKKMASPNLSSAASGSASASVGSAATNTTNIKAPLWDHVTILEKPKSGGGNALWSCKYCPLEKLSSYSRVEAHLMQIGGKGITKCPNVTYEMLTAMRKEIERCKNLVERSKPKHVSLPTVPSSSNTYTDESNKRSKRPTSALEKAWRMEDRNHLDALISRAIYSGGVAFNFLRNPYLREAFSFACSHNMQGYTIPGYNRAREGLLKQERRHIERLLESTKSTWAEKGVSICTDGWSDPQRRPIINFVAVCDKSPMFLRADNCEGEIKSKEYIAEKLRGIIEEVGRDNVVQIITDNAANCKGAGLIIEAEYKNIFWTPCVVHTLNLAMKNICEPKIGNNPSDEEVFVWQQLEFMHDVKTEAAMIKNFIMNHSMRLSMFNEFSHLKLLSIAETRFASVVCMLKRFVEVKSSLQQMVISDKWSIYKEVRDDSPTPTAQIVKNLILNDVWWDKVDYVLNITSPIYEMIRMTDTDTPCLHLVYEMWDSMIEKVKKVIYRHEGKEEDEHSELYSVIYDILIARWTKGNNPLHCLAHSLNPRYYSKNWIEEVAGREPPHKDKEVSKMRMTCFKKFFPNPEDLAKVKEEYARFSSCSEEFNDPDSIHDRWAVSPMTWWTNHGQSAPLLMSLAMKLLSQPASSSCCERNWSTYSFIHSVTRNALTPERAEDLVFVHSNLRHLSRRSDAYKTGETRMWDVGGDSFDSLGGIGVLEVADLSLDEPELQAITFGLDVQEVAVVDDNVPNEE